MQTQLSVYATLCRLAFFCLESVEMGQELVLCEKGKQLEGCKWVLTQSQAAEQVCVELLAYMDFAKPRLAGGVQHMAFLP